MSKYKSKIKYSKAKEDTLAPSVSRTEMAAKNSPRAKALRQHRSGKSEARGKGLFKLSKRTRKNLFKAFLVFLGAVMIAAVAGGLWAFSWVQELDAKLPSVEEPFATKEAASIMYDRNGEELSRLYNEYNRDPVNIDEIPYEVRWAFLAVEDVDFYTHDGFDVAAIARCAFINISSGSTFCGGSTVTQQTVKLTTRNDEVSIKRKLSELLMATKIEGAYNKDEILELYLTVVPFGRNVYGITSAANVYYGKEPKDLTLAEAAVLAGIINNPVFNSPTLAPDPVDGKRRSEERKEYILGQLLEKKDRINEQHRKNIDNPDAPDLITDELVTAAKEQKLKYVEAKFGYKPVAGHFIDYATEQLLVRNYKFGEEPFTSTDLQNGGYRIYTTLDLSLQKTSEKTVRDAVATKGNQYGASNAALVLLKPDNGHLLAMVGSKNYNGKSSGCKKDGTECRFDPQVNIATSLQSPGSSTKPHGFYEAYRRGLLFPGSFLPDIPISLAGGYSLKNWNGKTSGVGANYKYTAKEQLRNSLNLPAIIVVEMIGVENFLNVMRDFGYTTFTDSSQYGASVILGGSGVKMVEHAQGYGVFANGGDLVQHEVILKIEDRDGNLVYEAKPEKERVANPQAVYLLNQTLNNNYNLANEVWGGNNIADKTGTSEENKDTWFVAYSPNIVTIGWLGNNNNAKMSSDAFGSTSVKPWMAAYLQKISGHPFFAKKKPFNRPGNIIQGGGCNSGGCFGSEGNVGLKYDYMIKGKEYTVDNIRQKVTVCKDQVNRLARPIDITLGYAKTRDAIRYMLPDPKIQSQLDAYIKNKHGVNNAIPTEYCNKNRTGASGIAFSGSTNRSDLGSNNVRFSGSLASAGGQITSLKAYFDFAQGVTGVEMGDIAVNADGTFDATIAIPASIQATFEPGKYNVGLIAKDDQGGEAQKWLGKVTLGAGTTNNLNLTITPVGPYVWGTNIGNGTGVNLTLTYTGKGVINPGSVVVSVYKDNTFVKTVNLGNGPGYSATWGGDIANESATYTFSIAAGIANTGTIQTPGVIAKQVVVTASP